MPKGQYLWVVCVRKHLLSARIDLDGWFSSVSTSTAFFLLFFADDLSSIAVLYNRFRLFLVCPFASLAALAYADSTLS
jgi:hypothetical protein